MACEALGALALVGTWQVEAVATMLTLSWNFTLIDVRVALLPCEARWALARELIGHSETGASIGTGMRKTGIGPLAQLPCKANLAGALVGVPAKHVAGASIQARGRHKAGVRGGVLAVLACEPRGTTACGFP